MGVTHEGRGWLAPSRATWLLCAGLLAVYVGERIVSQLGVARWVLSGGGSALVLAALVLRVVVWLRAAGEARAVARLFLLTTAGCALALVGFLLTGTAGRVVGIDATADDQRLRTALLVGSAILLFASLLPLLAAQWAVGPARNSRTGNVDRLRISHTAAAGGVVALAGAFLMLAGYVANARDVALDLSYFKRASPGSATVRVAAAIDSRVRVLLFFPPASEIGDQVHNYFRELAAATGKVRVELHDRLAEPALAELYSVTSDGAVAITTGSSTEYLRVRLTPSEARVDLRNLDALVQPPLMRLARERRTVYLTVGHGELNAPAADTALARRSGATIDALRSLFQLLNYEVADLGVHNGLGQAVPGDAALVVVLGPRQPFLQPELEAIDRYLAQGGALLLALEPGVDFDLGPLESRLGVRFHPETLADDEQYLRQNDNLEDRQLIVTDRFAAHPALATLGQMTGSVGVALMGAGHLTTDVPGSQAMVVVYSLPSTFADLDRDLAFDAGTEIRQGYTLAAAVEHEVVSDTAAAADSSEIATLVPPRPMRALVIADAGLFADAVVTALGGNATLASDAIRWLGQDEGLAGETTSEQDVPIVHTRAKDVGWFYATIFGVPALVLAAGLFGVRRRRAALPGREA